MPGEALAVLFVSAVVVGAGREEQAPACRAAESLREGEDRLRCLRCVVGVEQFKAVDAPCQAVVKINSILPFMILILSLADPFRKVPFFIMKPISSTAFLPCLSMMCARP